MKRVKAKFALYLKVKEQQRDCSKYLGTMIKEVKEQQETFNECAAEMA